MRLFPLRVRLFQDITSPWAPVGAKKAVEGAKEENKDKDKKDDKK